MPDWRPSRRDLVVAVVLLVLALLGVLLAFLLSRGKAAFDLAAAYQAAAPGDTVCIPAGSYGGFVLAHDPAKDAGPAVTIAPCAGANPELARLELGKPAANVKAPRHLIVRDLRIDYTAVWDGASDIQLVNLRGRGFDVLYGSSYGYASDVSVIGGEYGPCEATDVGGECTNRLIGNRIVVDGAYIHDVTSRDPVTYHVDGAFVRGCVDCAIRNSVFARNDVASIRVQNCCGLQANRNLTLEGDWFGIPNGDDSTNVEIDNDTPGYRELGDTYEPRSGPYFQVAQSDARIEGTKLLQNGDGSALGAACQTVTYSSSTMLPWTSRSGPADWNGGWGNVTCTGAAKATQAWPYAPPDLSWRPPSGGTTTVPTTVPPTTTVPTTAPIPPSTTTVVSTVTLPPVTVTQPPTTVTVGTNSLCKPSDPSRANPDYLCKPAP